MIVLPLLPSAAQTGPVLAAGTFVAVPNIRELLVYTNMTAFSGAADRSFGAWLQTSFDGVSPIDLPYEWCLIDAQSSNPQQTAVQGSNGVTQQRNITGNSLLGSAATAFRSVACYRTIGGWVRVAFSLGGSSAVSCTFSVNSVGK
jgi:hypothetical protein